MRRKIVLLLFAVFVLSAAIAQQKVTLEDIWLKGTFRPAYFYDYKPYGNHSLLLPEFAHGVFVLKEIDMADGKEKAVFSNRNHREIPYVYDYVFSPDLRKMLIAGEVEPVYRHSFWGKYYLYDRAKDVLTPFSKGRIQIPSFFPDGNRVVYFKDNNLYIKDLSSGNVVPVTTDGEKNKIINGKTDWVYEEEFGFVKAYAVSADGRYLAYLKFDESAVPEFTMTEYADYLYPKAVTFKYPKAGQKNSVVTLWVYDTKTGKTTQVDLGAYEYVPYLKKGYAADDFMVITMNRHQNREVLYRVRNGKANVLLRKTDDKYIDFEAENNLTFLTDGSFIWSSEKDGFNHLYWYARNGRLKRKLTTGKWEVTDFYGVNEKTGKFYFQSTGTGSINRGIYEGDLHGKKYRLLSPAQGTATATFSKDFKYFVQGWSDVKTPYQYTVVRTNDAETIRVLEDNKRLKKVLTNYELPEIRFIRIPAADGKTLLNAYVIYPLNFDKEKQYPLLIYGYNGPGVQTVRNAWPRYDYFYYAMLAGKGFIIVSVDTRGTGGRGAAFKKITYKQLGHYELQDLKATAQYWAAKPFVDKKKIGIWGWSYGGFMAANAILQAGDIFSYAIAVAPVTNWRFYDTVYTERYMQTPEENPDGYDDNSPLTYAANLKGDFLLIHGTADDNVHVQNSYRLAKALQENGKTFRMMIYPDRNHGIYGGKTRYQLYTTMYNFLTEQLKK